MFGSTGIIRVENAFPCEIAETISDQIWAVFAQSFGIEHDNRETWSRTFRKRALDRLSISPLFDEMVTDRFAKALDGILGPGWDWPTSWGDFLITFPTAGQWMVPTAGWHQDWSFTTDCDPPRFVKAFAFLNRVMPGDGGTLVVAGSHLLNDRYGRSRVVDDRGRASKGSDQLYIDCGYLRDLAIDGDPAMRIRRFLGGATRDDGIDLQVVELTGEPGDVVLIHPWLVYAVAPNAGDTPRFMRAPVFKCGAQ